MLLQWLDAIASCASWSLTNAHHERDIWAVHIGIKQPRLMPKPRKGDREIDRNRGFSDATLARPDSNQLSNTRYRQLWLLSRRVWTHVVDGISRYFAG